MTTNKRRLAGIAIRVFFGVFLVGLIVCNLIVASNSKYIFESTSELQATLSDKPVAIVFGGGITVNKQPAPLLQKRLDTAAKLFSEGLIGKILVSGDNRFADYNEPQVMEQYLIDTYHISSELIQQDNAGRSTYETCERARKIFGQQKAVLISQASHLPRAIFLCRSFGMQAYGYPAESIDEARFSQSIREAQANVKAIFNVYFYGEKTILGKEINF